MSAKAGKGKAQYYGEHFTLYVLKDSTEWVFLFMPIRQDTASDFSSLEEHIASKC